jgi:hypothetical protein
MRTGPSLNMDRNNGRGQIGIESKAIEQIVEQHFTFVP